MGNQGTSLAFIGSYGSADVPRIRVVSFASSGAASLLASTDGITNPSFLAVHPDGGTLYSLSETGRAGDGTQGQVHALRIERSDDALDLVPLGARSSHGDHPCHVNIDRSGRWLFATNYSSGDIVVFPIDDDGGLAEAVTRVVHTGGGAHAERQGSPHPHSSVLSPDEQFLIVADLGIDQLIVYAWDARSGDLQRHSIARSRSGAGPRSAVFDPSGRYLCVVNELDNTIALLAWDATQGTLEEVQVVSTLPAGLDVPNLAADVCFDLAGRAVYVSNRGHDSVMAYSFDPNVGLTTIGSRPSGGRSPRAMAVSPGGEHLLIANERSDLVVSMLLAGREAESEATSPVLSIENPSVVVFA